MGVGFGATRVSGQCLPLADLLGSSEGVSVRGSRWSAGDVLNCREADAWTAHEGVMAGSTPEHYEHYVRMSRG